jgi:hypothetical protein
VLTGGGQVLEGVVDGVVATVGGDELHEGLAEDVGHDHGRPEGGGDVVEGLVGGVDLGVVVVDVVVELVLGELLDVGALDADGIALDEGLVAVEDVLVGVLGVQVEVDLELEQVEVLVLEGVGELVDERGLQVEVDLGAPDEDVLGVEVVLGEGAGVLEVVGGAGEVEVALGEAEGAEELGLVVELGGLVGGEVALVEADGVGVLLRGEELDLDGVVELQPAGLLDVADEAGDLGVPVVGVLGVVLDLGVDDGANRRGDDHEAEGGGREQLAEVGAVAGRRPLGGAGQRRGWAAVGAPDGGALGRAGRRAAPAAGRRGRGVVAPRGRVGTGGGEGQVGGPLQGPGIGAGGGVPGGGRRRLPGRRGRDRWRAVAVGLGPGPLGGWGNVGHACPCLAVKLTRQSGVPAPRSRRGSC